MKNFDTSVHRTLSRSFVCLTSILGLCAGTAFLSPAAQGLQPLSLRHPGIPSAAGAGGDSYAPLLSPDGRYVLFASTAQNLALATNSLPFQGAARPVLNVYWRDRQEQRTVLVTRGLSGTEVGNSNSLPVALSTNGLLALVESTASNLVPNDTNSAADVFLFDLEHGQTVLVSAGTNGLPGNGASSHPVLSADGRYVAFTSLASNLVANDTNNVSDIFLRDLQSGLTLLVSTNVQPSPTLYTNLGSDLPQMTPDGRKVAFVVNAKNQTTLKLTASINVRDLVTGTTVWASSDAAAALGLPSTSEVSCFSPGLSDDGAFLAYEATTSGATVSPASLLRYNLNIGTTEVIHTNVLVPTIALDEVQNVDLSTDGQLVAFLANTNGSDSCVLVWDASSGNCTLASANLTNGVSTGATCQAPRLDPQGRWVAFMSSAPDLVTNTLTGDYHLYQRDLVNGTTTLLDVDETGASWPLTALSIPILSADARYVAFECVRPQVSGNQYSDIFVLDRQSGASELVSRYAPELPSATANGAALPLAASLSADGRVVAFSSDAEDLVPNDGNGFRDVFVYDWPAATNLLVSANLEASSGNGPSFAPVVSGNGRYVAFSSVATNLVPGDVNSAQDVFVRDLQSGQTVLASVAWNGASANSNSSLASVSDDGRYVLCRSLAGNLVQGYFTGENLFLRDMQQGTNFALTSGSGGVGLGGTDMTPNGRFAAYSFKAGQLGSSYVSVWDTELKRMVFSNTIPAVTPQVSIAPDGSQLAWVSNSVGGYSTVLQSLATGTKTILGATSNTWIRPRFSGDSHWLVFGSMAQGAYQLYLRDLVNGTNLLVSRSASAGAPAAGDSDSPALSPDGRFVAYRSAASDIVPGDTNGAPDVFLFDRVTASTLLLSVNWDGSSANSRSGSPCFSADGQTLAFGSWASNLTPLDFNAQPDLFAYRLSSSGAAFYVQALLSGGVPTLLWPAESGKTYRVQFKDDLRSTGWQDAPGTITVSGSQCSYSDPAPSAKRFFRVVAQ